MKAEFSRDDLQTAPAGSETLAEGREEFGVSSIKHCMIAWHAASRFPLSFISKALCYPSFPHNLSLKAARAIPPAKASP